MQDPKIHSKSVLWRYLLFQVPGILFVGVIAYYLVRFEIISQQTAWLALAVWVAKDAAMYPFVWKAYIAGLAHNRSGHLGKRVLVVESLDPKGQVKVEGTIWHAQHRQNTPVPRGQMVKVVAEEGLILLVESD